MSKEPTIPDNLFTVHGKEVEKILHRAVREVLLRHKKLGQSVAVGRDGKVIIIPPEEIVLPEEEDEAQSLRPPQ